MSEDQDDKKKEYIRIPDDMSLLDYILSLPDDEEYTPEFIERMQKIMSEKPIFVGTMKELDKLLDVNSE